MQQLSPYIIFNGNCEEALNFCAKAFNGKIKDLMRFEGPPAAEMTADTQKVLHAHFVSKGVFFMASDSGEGGPAAAGGGMIHLSLNFDDPAELEKVFKALSEGATISMPLQDTFWGARFGMLTDKFGINWMFNHDYEKQ